MLLEVLVTNMVMGKKFESRSEVLLKELTDLNLIQYHFLKHELEEPYTIRRDKKLYSE